jgi:hypothetical protein
VSINSYLFCRNERNVGILNNTDVRTHLLIFNCASGSKKKILLIYLLGYLPTHLLTPWATVLLEKLTGFQLVKKFSSFYGTRRFITAFTSAPPAPVLSQLDPVHASPHPTSWRSILILSSHLRLGLRSGLFPSGFPTKSLYIPLFFPIRATCPAHLILLDLITRTILGEEDRSVISLLCSFIYSPRYLVPLRPKYSP